MMSPLNFGSSSFGNLTLTSCETEEVLFEIFNKFNDPTGGILLKRLSIFAISLKFESSRVRMSSSSLSEYLFSQVFPKIRFLILVIQIFGLHSHTKKSLFCLICSVPNFWCAANILPEYPSNFSKPLPI